VARRRRHPLYKEVEITSVAAEGKAIARIDDLVVFVVNTVPGDIVDVQVNKKRKSYREGYPVKFHKYSELRIEPFCAHFEFCGGCKWQQLPYEEQLNFKEKQVLDQLERIGKVEGLETKKILPSSKTQYYRNKLEYSFSNKRWLTNDEIDTLGDNPDLRALGFHVPGKFDKIIDIEHCYLQPEPSNKIRNFVNQYARSHGLDFFDIRKQEGFLRSLIVRNTSEGQVMVIFVLYYEDEEKRIDLLCALKEEFPEIDSIMYVINGKPNETISDLEVKLYEGNDFITEKMEDLKFRIGPKSFFQTNTDQSYELYKLVREYCNLQGSEVVYDLYTGTGTIANFVARSASKVVGIEYIEEAVADARKNSDLNEISNTDFVAGDMKDVLTEEFIEINGRPDVVILDPPRAGIHPDVIKVLLNTHAKRIVYVSCNPATQARDIRLLSEKYKTILIHPVDMFPHTHHVENIAVLELE